MPRKAKSEIIIAKLDKIISDSTEILRRLGHVHTHEITMSLQLDNLTTEVGEAKTVTESAVTLIGGLAQQIRDFANEPAKLQALADELDANTKKLAAKVEENTTPVPAPEVPPA